MKIEKIKTIVITILVSGIIAFIGGMHYQKTVTVENVQVHLSQSK